MEKKEILKSLNEIVYQGTKISNIEKEVGLPKNSLSSVLTGKKEMPHKWVPKLEKYLVIKLGIDGAAQVQTVANTMLGTGWMKAKGTSETDRLEQLLEWGPKIEAFCEKKGFPVSELIKKYEEMERLLQMDNPKRENFFAPNGAFAQLGQNKPNTAPETEKRIQDTPEWKKGKEKAENTFTGIPPMPVRMEGEDGLDYSARKNEWKKKYVK